MRPTGGEISKINKAIACGGGGGLGTDARLAFIRAILYKPGFPNAAGP
jgi:hypothetical protein